ncbi:MAG: putative LPS assembly protein LptD [candidate division Zixibacteria bacterium]|nr:putative LPS assembly protein LptD [candidate division Zixibacteria bacterium]
MTYLLLAFTLLLAADVCGQKARKLDLLYADETEFIFSRLQDTTYVTGSVVFETESGLIYCDSAMWAKGKQVTLLGRVIIDDREYRLAADSVKYDLLTGRAVARGSYVELWSRPDSLFAVGTHAFYDRDRRYFYMQERPTVYLNYPDSSRMIEVIGDFVEYDAAREIAEAEGTVRITSDEFTSSSGCAIMHPRKNTLDLFDNPSIHRKKSEISGRFITVASDAKTIKRVDVIDSARAEFSEPINPLETDFDRSILTGRRILLDFIAGDLRTVTCYNQAYSWYNPAPVHKEEQIENTVSGDTIRFYVSNEQLQEVEVTGGAIGSYLSSARTEQDSVVQITTDTVNYQADHITYSLRDSLITLRSQSKCESEAVSLEAYQIQLDTRTRMIEAFSAALSTDSTGGDNDFARKLQPNDVPVVLRDREQQLYGDYLEYSLDTEKGRIVKSKSDYETGFFYGEKLHRQHKDIFYLQNGRYTTCNATEPHFHFSSDNLKLIEGKRLIARPVILNVGRLPILAIPFYVFPLEKGRHSGILPFSLGNIERGERYVRNVGYYWAASQFWDWQGALDYFDDRDRLNLYSKLTYKKLYAFDGSISGTWGRERSFNDSTIEESRKSRWTLKVTHNHEVSPSFRFSASGDFQSDKSFYSDYSTNLEERLNRVVRSQLNFTKRFGKSVSLSGSLSHDNQLDKESTTDRIPSLGVTLPAFRPFGSGSIDEQGNTKRHWYNELIVTYRPRIENFSSRVKKDSSFAVYDSLNTDSIIYRDTVSYRSRKEYTRVDHIVSVNFPLTVARYFILNPSLQYSENWFRIYSTDQSEKLNIDASTDYRTYRYEVGASFSTKIFGTIYPNVFGLSGLRQVITPQLSYHFTPKSDRHPVINSYAGGGARSASKSQSVSLSLGHVYQAKVKSGDQEQSYELLSVSHGVSHDFESTGRKWSNLNTDIRSNLLKNVRLDAEMTHSLYRSPTSDELDFWHPHMLSFRLDASTSLKGRRFLFDDPVLSTIRGTDSSSQSGFTTPASGLSGGWDLSLTYSFNESGKWSGLYRKSSSIRLSLQFNLTPTTNVDYSQYYDIASRKTVANQVSIVKTIHCWTGTFHWVPTGSMRGWGFMLYVTAMPAIKIDNSQSTLNSSYFTGSR